MGWIHTLRNMHPALWLGAMAAWQVGSYFYAKGLDSIPKAIVATTNPVCLGALSKVVIGAFVDGDEGSRPHKHLYINFASGVIVGIEGLVLASAFNARIANTKMMSTILDHKALSFVIGLALVAAPQLGRALGGEKGSE